jgi:acyl-CoA thioester hydrolase
MAAFVTQVPLRWTDQDAYQHLNHARAVTLLEEARIELFFHDAVSSGVSGFVGGLFVVSLHVDYKKQVAYRSRTLRVALTIDDVRAASFVIRYRLHLGPDADDPVAVIASTKMAVFDMVAQIPRRIEDEERAFLLGYSDDPDEART